MIRRTGFHMRFSLQSATVKQSLSPADTSKKKLRVLSDSVAESGTGCRHSRLRLPESKRGLVNVAIVGILLVFGAVIGGFLMEKGQIAVFMQPAEFLIIVGAGLGTLLIAHPLDPSNRRISLIVRNLDAPSPSDGTSVKESAISASPVANIATKPAAAVPAKAPAPQSAAAQLLARLHAH